MRARKACCCAHNQSFGVGKKQGLLSAYRMWASFCLMSTHVQYITWTAWQTGVCQCNSLIGKWSWLRGDAIFPLTLFPPLFSPVLLRGRETDRLCPHSEQASSSQPPLRLPMAAASVEKRARDKRRQARCRLHPSSRLLLSLASPPGRSVEGQPSRLGRHKLAASRRTPIRVLRPRLSVKLVCWQITLTYYEY